MSQKNVIIKQAKNGYEILSQGNELSIFYESGGIYGTEIPREKFSVILDRSPFLINKQSGMISHRSTKTFRDSFTLVDVVSTQEEAYRICRQKALEIAKEKAGNEYEIIEKTFEEVIDERETNKSEGTIALTCALAGGGLGGLGKLFFESYIKRGIRSELQTELVPHLNYIVQKNTPLSHAGVSDVTYLGFPYPPPSIKDDILHHLSDGVLTHEEAQKLSQSIVERIPQYVNETTYNATEISSRITNAFIDFARDHQDAITQYATNAPYDNFGLWVACGAIIGGTTTILIEKYGSRAVHALEKMYSEIRGRKDE